ncbi:MAG TPA: DegT/DnrJ/EryC1/StrS family aminotransferase [candidate division Zixibacteria bacterium]|nr:DegT/DnrJ/EryC1/StrS family aminotransferase [candidate division Zixibacteria bacterium]MDD4917800.1 DegT/DnrJ/EryC1/StrS family aminotransferase [candidate division Zixibacteria bacterium]MDM7973902.1 DegT/DnrJ/EryC1/StrS family aminotransferase [candidate division Zixibacteria bacterium]HOD66085.1 DegT/DnrJ/EryC1/StrS family aminotransferase [candidate division Zixibacteria bacterium]HPM38038.1 DegT/DnrJ/EryC1/StrS family aminotransferase [candidate division Zixibacteria bacterium]
MKVPYLDLQAQYQSIKDDIAAAVQRVLDSSTYVLGPSVREFEEAFARYCGTAHCAGVNSGTSALVLALRALEIGPGDEVVTAANTFVATVAAIAHTGAHPVLVDIDPRTRTIDPRLLPMALSRRTRAVIPVHLYGRPADMEAIMRLAEKYEVSVVEDAAQAHGARYRGRRIGSFGRLAAFSFYPGKNLGAYGEAGAVTTDDPELDRRLRMLRDHGSERKYYHDLVGYNARMEGIQGAVLGVKLRRLDQWNEARRRVAARYDELLRDLPVTTPPVDPEVEPVYHLYVIETERRDALQAFLAERGVPTLIHYPVPVHLQRGYDFLGRRKGDFPVAERQAEQILSLPIFPEMTEAQVDYVAAQIQAFFHGA